MALETNVANEPGKTLAEKQRIPMSVPQLKLEVPELPGFHLHWMRGDPGRIQQALRAGYTFVEDHEIALNNELLGGDGTTSGNTDLGSRVSVVAGGEATDGHGQAVRLYLMKLPEEYHKEDMQKRDEQAGQLAATLSQGMIDPGKGDETAEDVSRRYVDRNRTTMPDFFKPRAQRRPRTR